MTDLIARKAKTSTMQLPGLVSRPGDERYASATSTWAKQRGVAPRFVVHCRTASDVQTAIRVARSKICHFRSAAAGTTGPVARSATAS